MKQATELPGKINRNARMNSALAIEEALAAAQCEHAFMPNIWMNIHSSIWDGAISRSLVAGTIGIEIRGSPGGSRGLR